MSAATSTASRGCGNYVSRRGWIDFGCRKFIYRTMVLTLVILTSYLFGSSNLFKMRAVAAQR